MKNLFIMNRMDGIISNSKGDVIKENDVLTFSNYEANEGGSPFTNDQWRITLIDSNNELVEVLSPTIMFDYDADSDDTPKHGDQVSLFTEEGNMFHPFRLVMELP